MLMYAAGRECGSTGTRAAGGGREDGAAYRATAPGAGGTSLLAYFLYWYKSIPTPAADAQHIMRQLQALEILNLLALLVQNYEY